MDVPAEDKKFDPKYELMNELKKGFNVGEDAIQWTKVLSLHGHVEAHPAQFVDLVSGMTALHLTAYFGQIEVLEWAIDDKCDVNLRNALGRAPLHMACESNQPEAVEMLCRNMANVNVLSLNCSTPLMLACRNNAYDSCRALLHQEWNLVDDEIEDSHRMTAMKYAENHVRLQRELKRYRVKRKALFQKDMMTRWLRPLFDIFDQDGNGGIDQSEFAAVQVTFAHHMGYEVSEVQVKNMFRKADVNHDNRINFDEFAKAYEELIGGMKRPLDEIVATLKSLAITFKAEKGVLLPQLLSVDPEASAEFRKTCEEALFSASVAAQIKKLPITNPHIAEGKRGGAKISSDEMPMGMIVHLGMNPHWEVDVLEILKACT